MKVGKFRNPETNRMNKIKHIEITSRKWFDRTYGNTYFSAVGYINGFKVASIDFEYGYGDHYVDCITREMLKAGHLTGLESNVQLWRYCENNNITKLFVSSDVTRKRDL